MTRDPFAGAPVLSEPTSIASSSPEGHATDDTLDGANASIRLGAPRPLAGYLAAASASAHQAAALAAEAEDPRFPWRPSLRAAGAAQAAEMRAIDPTALRRAVSKEALGALTAMLDGVERYQSAPSRPAPSIAPVAWRGGSARLLDFTEFARADDRGPQSGPALLALPSLINRHRVLDLTETRSLMRGLARRGVQPYLMDWGDPGVEERGFTLEDYVTRRIAPALDAVAARHGGRVAVLGHCMSGPLAIAAAQLCERGLVQARVTKAVALGAPWRFDPFFAGAAGPKPTRETLEKLITSCGEVFGGVPKDVLNTLFFMRDPLQALRKFPAFRTLDLATPRARLFVALEDWLNDGVLLVQDAARTLLIDWSLDDHLAGGRWIVAGEPLTVGALQTPILAVASKADTLVPYASATSLFADTPRAKLLRPTGGHIGMIVGRKAERELWDPLARWLLL